MLIRLISLVILFVLSGKTFAFTAENTIFIYPKDKPSVFKKKIVSNELKKKTLLPANKPQPAKEKQLKINEKEKINKIKKKKIVKKIDFLYPKKKPATYKTNLKIEKDSTILNKKDFEKAKEIFKLINSGKWITAVNATEKVKDKEFKKLVKWMYLKRKANNATFTDYKSFIEKNDYYPRISRLKYLAESKIVLRNTTPKSVINWFEKNPPLGGTGKIKLAEAYFATGDNEKAKSLLKSGWVNANLSKSDLRYYRNKFKKILSEQDHILRADYLAWNNKYWDLKRMLRYLPKDERALYTARQILISNSYGVDKSISNVPNHLKKNIGLEYDRLKWRNRRGRLESSLEILYENGNRSAEELIRPDLWWKQRESIVRSLIYKKRYKSAYKVASEHSLSDGPEFAEAEWLSGWISLSFLKSGEYAISHFENFYNNVGYPISLARGAYWLGKSYQSVGNEKLSKQYFEEGSRFLTTYYGQLSFSELYPEKEFSLVDQTAYTKEYEDEFNNNKLIRHIVLLKELNQTKYTKDIVKHLAQLNIQKGSEVLAAKLATDIERYDYAIQISKQASYEKRFFNQFNYPIISTPREINKKIMPPSELILAIIRQESEFDRRANSYVGARGMMQLMKYTAKIVAKQANLPYSISGLTKDPEYNIKLGTYYFNSLLKDYNGVYPFAIAAYNAGPKRVKTWRRINGDPSKNQISYINWIELIRFKETRNYVQRVIENANVYKYMLNQKPVKLNGFYK